MLTPRGSNHATLTEDDLMLLYCLYKGGRGEGSGTSETVEQEPAEIPTLGVHLLSQNEPQTPRPPHDKPMSSFERLIISRMDDITEQQRCNHEYCVTQFQHLSGIT